MKGITIDCTNFVVGAIVIIIMIIILLILIILHEPDNAILFGVLIGVAAIALLLIVLIFTFWAMNDRYLSSASWVFLFVAII